MSAGRFIRRLLSALLFIALVSTAGLLLARVAPGDYADTLRAARLDAATIEREKARLYLDRSLPELAGIWLTHLARFDFGESYRFSRPVRGLLLERAPRTFLLLSLGLATSLSLAIVWAVLQIRGPMLLQRSVRGLAAFGLSLPAVVVLFFILVVLGRLGWLAYLDMAIVMPAASLFALALPASSALSMIHAQALREALGEPWAVAAMARGVPERRLVWRSAMKVASNRLVNMFPYVAANILSVSLLIEVVAGWAGLGRLTLDALVARDVFLVAGCTASLAAMMVVLTALADVAAAMLDPRIRHEESVL